MDCSPPGSSVHGDSLGKNTGVGCHALLQRRPPYFPDSPVVWWKEPSHRWHVAFIAVCGQIIFRALLATLPGVDIQNWDKPLNQPLPYTPLSFRLNVRFAGSITMPDWSQSFLAFHPEIHPVEFLQWKQIPGLGLRLSVLSILAGYRIWTDGDFASAHTR